MDRMKPSGPPILIAFKSLATCGGLTLIQRRVGAALLDHYNRKTERCDPSNGTISRILGVSTRSVVRATAALVSAGFFRKHVHGGLGHRNQYEPNWAEFERQELLWRKRRASASRMGAWRELSPSPGQASPGAPDMAVQQTCSLNPIEKTFAAGHAPAISNDQPCGQRLKWPGKQEQGPKPWTSSNGLGLVSRQEAADERAIARWDAHLRNHFGPNHAAYGEAVNAICPELIARATAQERACPGTGAALLLRELQTRSLTVSTGTCDG